MSGIKPKSAANSLPAITLLWLLLSSFKMESTLKKSGILDKVTVPNEASVSHGNQERIRREFTPTQYNYYLKFLN